MLDADEASTISTRFRFSLAASGVAPLAVFLATTSTALPVEGSTSIFPLTLMISTRPPGWRSYVFRQSAVSACRSSAVTMSHPWAATAATRSTGTEEPGRNPPPGWSNVHVFSSGNSAQGVNTPMARSVFRVGRMRGTEGTEGTEDGGDGGNGTSFNSETRRHGVSLKFSVQSRCRPGHRPGRAINRRPAGASCGPATRSLCPRGVG